MKLQQRSRAEPQLRDCGRSGRVDPQVGRIRHFSLAHGIGSTAYGVRLLSTKPLPLKKYHRGWKGERDAGYRAWGKLSEA